MGEPEEDASVPRPDFIAETMQGLGEAGSELAPEPEPAQADPTTGAVIPQDGHAADRARADGRRVGGTGPEGTGPWGTDEPTQGEGPWGVSPNDPGNEGSEETAVPESTVD